MQNSSSPKRLLTRNGLTRWYTVAQLINFLCSMQYFLCPGSNMYWKCLLFDFHVCQHGCAFAPTITDSALRHQALPSGQSTSLLLVHTFVPSDSARSSSSRLSQLFADSSLLPNFPRFSTSWSHLALERCVKHVEFCIHFQPTFRKCLGRSNWIEVTSKSF